MLSLYFSRLFFLRLASTFGLLLAAMMIINGYEVMSKMPTMQFSTVMLATLLMLPGMIGYVLPISVYLALVGLISYLYQNKYLLGFMTLGLSTKRLAQYLLPWILWLGCVSAVCHIIVEPFFEEELQDSLQSYVGQKMLAQMPGEQFHKIMIGDQYTVLYFKRDKNKLLDIFAWVNNKEKTDVRQLIHADEMTMKGKNIQLKNGERWVHDASKSFAWSQFEFNDYLLQQQLMRQDNRHENYKDLSVLWQQRFHSRLIAVALNERLMLPMMFVILSIIPFALVRPSARPVRYLVFIEAMVFFLWYVLILIMSHSYIKRLGWSTALFLLPHLSTLVLVGIWWLFQKSHWMGGGKS